MARTPPPPKLGWSGLNVLHRVILALALGLTIIGVGPVVAAFFFWPEMYEEHVNDPQWVGTWVFFLILVALALLLATPAAWRIGFRFVRQTFSGASVNEVWSGRGNADPKRSARAEASSPEFAFDSSAFSHARKSEDAQRTADELRQARERAQRAEEQARQAEERARKAEEESRQREHNARSREVKTTRSAEDEALALLEMKRPYTLAELKKRRGELLRKIHPDVGGSNAMARMVNEAFELLKARL